VPQKTHQRRRILSTPQETVEKLKELEANASALKKNLVLKMEELKKLTESKATALENEVKTLKQEIESSKTLLEVKNEKKTNQKSKPREPH